jgi:hypothetical protein
MKIRTSIAATIVAGAIALGAGASTAFAAGDTSGAATGAPVTQDVGNPTARCARIEHRMELIATRAEQVRERITRLEQLAKDHPKRADRIQQRIDRLQARLTKVTTPPAWYTQHCVPTPSPAN